jgi:hypothetical protein
MFVSSVANLQSYWPQSSSCTLTTLMAEFEGTGQEKTVRKSTINSIRKLGGLNCRQVRNYFEYARANVFIYSER